MKEFVTITGTVIRGDGRGGRVLSTPTLNVDPASVPTGIVEGVYAALVQIDDQWLPASVHYGTRPTFGSSLSFEVHVIDQVLTDPPSKVSVRLLDYLRVIQKFPNVEALKLAIGDDIRRSREIALMHSA